MPEDKHMTDEWRKASKESNAFALVAQAVRAYCEVMNITNDDKLDEIYEKVIDLFIDLTEPSKS